MDEYYKKKYLKYKSLYVNLKKYGGASSNFNRKISAYQDYVRRKANDFDIPSHIKKAEKCLNSFRELIVNNNYLRNLMEKMLTEIPLYIRDDCIKNYVGYEEEWQPTAIDDYFSELLSIITSAPKWQDFNNPYNGLPITNFVIHSLSTPSGFLFYGNIIVNNNFKRILEVWKEYLDSPSSRHVLTLDGWLGMYSIDEFDIDKSDKYYGFKSWNDFFIRKFKDFDKVRPLADSIIVAPADFRIINYTTNLDYISEFLSIKGDDYSLYNILGSIPEKIKKKFIDGFLIQGFLDAEHYHRYHSPVDGKLIKCILEPGSFYLLKNYSELNGNKFCGQGHVIQSEKFFTNVQTRGIFIFETKHLGLVAMIVIGMIEVSSCILYKNLLNTNVKRGQEIGYFQYGGSSICLIFEKKALQKINLKIKTKNFNLDREEMVKIRSSIATLKK